MRKAIAPAGFAVLVALAVTATSNASFGHAGSTGGPIGKTDKSQSGIGLLAASLPFAILNLMRGES
jgi:hypothetical protein